jgi:hypothetical protein
LSQAQPAPSAAGPGVAPTDALAGADGGKLEKLMALGFTREQCEAALKMTNGSEEYAASVLFDQML